MSEATGTTTVVVESPEGTPLTTTLDNSTGEVIQPTTEAVPISETLEPIETVADATVQVAQIEADARVEIEGIRADVETAAIEARAEGEQEWQVAMNSLREEMTALGEAVTATATVVEQLVAQSTPPASPELTTEPETLEPTTTDTSETLTETSSETRTEVPERNGAESLEEPPVAVMRRKVRMI